MPDVTGSSALAAIDYDEISERLTVTFRDGSVYTYEDVPASEWRGLVGAASAGGYFNANIRNEYSYVVGG